MNKHKITASVVLYENDISEIERLLDSIFRYHHNLILYLIDNSPSDKLKAICAPYGNIVYKHVPENVGFGAGHNIALKYAKEEKSDFHFVINPDVYFEENVFETMVHYMQEHDAVGMLMPQILNIDGSIQNLPKLLPTPYSVLMRKIKKPHFVYTKFIENYELRFVEHRKVYNAPILSGCFTLFRMEALEKIGYYDSRFFMYFEDWDLSRRMHETYQTIYYPLVSVFHGYRSEANKSMKLFKIFVSSAMAYFNKWGWFFDAQRKTVNEKALNQFR